MSTEGGRLVDLPDPPPGRTGWPWTEETPAVPPHTPEGHPWPRITIVTPSFNQGEFLEETLRSVLLQGYSNLEYLVMDGGSTDRSVEILQIYEPWLSGWVSEKDRGQSHAINKGFRRATGDIIAWLNSDDIYFPGALEAVGRLMADGQYDLTLGSMEKVQVDGERRRRIKLSTPYGGDPVHYYPVLKSGERATFTFYQPAMFWTRDLWERVGELDESYHYVMDLQWCHRALAAGARVGTQEMPIARFAIHEESKTNQVSHLFSYEQVRMYREFALRPEFDGFQCFLSGLRQLQLGVGRSSNRFEARGAPLRTFAARNAARGLKAVRAVLPKSPAIRVGQNGPNEE